MQKSVSPSFKSLVSKIVSSVLPFWLAGPFYFFQSGKLILKFKMALPYPLSKHTLPVAFVMWPHDIEVRMVIGSESTLYDNKVLHHQNIFLTCWEIHDYLLLDASYGLFIFVAAMPRH
jgi:hypothetical protein